MHFSLVYKCERCSVNIDVEQALFGDIERQVKTNIEQGKYAMTIFHDCWKVTDYAYGYGIAKLVGYNKMLNEVKNGS
jgi:hypothetical protein